MAIVAVTLEAVSYAYPDGQPALHGVSLEVRAGEAFGIVGPNGAGKSTLLLHVNGILRGSGCVRVGDLQVTERTLDLVRARVGLLFQNPDDQLFMPTVREDAEFGPLNHGLSQTETARRVEAALAAAGAAALADRPPHRLSLGQKKRAALAAVLAMECEVLVFDEPTSGLDPRGRRELAAHLAGLPQTRLIATHDLEFAAQVCHRVAVLFEGRIAALGPPREILADAGLMDRTGLEVPPSLRAAAGACPRRPDPPA